MLKEIIQNRIGFGTGKLSVMPTLNSALYILETAFDNGIVHFDTAPIYGSGYSEKIIGRFASNKRDKIFIATKFGLSSARKYKLHPFFALPLNHFKHLIKKQSIQKRIYEPGKIEYRLISKIDIEASLKESLQNLKTDYLDYFLLHEALPNFLDDAALNYIFELKKKGVVKKIGLGASSINYLNLAQENLNEWDVLQYEFSPDGTSVKMHNQFKDKEHIVHSILANGKAPNHIFPEEYRAGYLLADYLKQGLANKVLLSTSKVNTLKTNICALNLYS